MKNTVRLLIFLIITSLLLVSCGGAGSDTIKVGGIGELTGDIPAVGASFKNAAEIAVAEINDAGGLEVGGKKYMIELVIEDNAGKAEQSAFSNDNLTGTE